MSNPKLLNDELAGVVADLLCVSWREILFKYDGLTPIEQRAVSREEHAELIQWLVALGKIYADPKGGYTLVGQRS
jgi:hypothetical protein